jgi:hypothetical protein
MKTKETPASPAPESDFALTDALPPAFLTEGQAAQLLGLTPHQLYLYRCGKKARGPPFVMHGARIRYPVAELQDWARNLPRFVSRAEAYAANPQRARAAARQRTATARARKTRWDKQDGATTNDA